MKKSKKHRQKQEDWKNLLDAWKLAGETNKLTRGQKQIIKLWNKHNGICYICGEMVPNPLTEREKLNFGLYPTRDHVIPISKLGAKGLQNIKLTHRKCNKKKGNLFPEELTTRKYHRQFQV